MADYININGNNIPIRASDPSNPIAGEIWYNLTTNALKGQIFQSAAWSTITARNTTTRGSGQTGTVTAGLVTAGFTGSFPIIRNTEEYNGSTWTEVNDTGSDHYVASMSGTQTTAIIAGGYQTLPNPAGAGNNAAETYDGTNWTSIPTINNRRYGMGNVGDSSLAIIFGGENTASVNTTNTEEWNGSAWTEVNDMNTGMNYRGSIGNSQTDCYAVGGLVPGSPNKSANVEQWDGTSWTAANSLNTAVFVQGCWGTPTSGVSVGGNGPASAQTEIWDGTCFSISPASLNTGRDTAWNGFGTSGSNGILAGGYTGTANTNAVEEFQGAGPATVTFSSS